MQLICICHFKSTFFHTQHYEPFFRLLFKSNIFFRYASPQSVKYFRRKYVELLKLCVPLDLSRTCLHVLNHFCLLNLVHSFDLSCLFEVWNHSKASINQFTPYILPIFYWSFMQSCDACVVLNFNSHIYVILCIFWRERTTYLWVFLSQSVWVAPINEMKTKT